MAKPELHEFRREYLRRWAARDLQCEVRSIRDRCPNKATFALRWSEHDGVVCDQCVAGWLHELTRSGGEVVVRPITGADKDEGESDD